MANDYLWDRTGVPERSTRELEELLAPATHDAPLDELRLARRGEPVRATAHEPAPPDSGRKKGKMIFLFDKRVIGIATLAATGGLLALNLLHRHAEPDRPAITAVLSIQSDPSARIPPPLVQTPHAAPLAPLGDADLAITAGESVSIHTGAGTVEVEIHTACDAEIQMILVSRFGSDRHLGTIAGTVQPDGRATTFRLGAGDTNNGLFDYTATCADRPPVTGHILVDRENVHQPIDSTTNARVYSSEFGSLNELEEGFHVFGTVMPGAKVSIGAKPIALETIDRLDTDPPIAFGFATNTPISIEHMTAAIRVDDLKGTHFYVLHATMAIMSSCATSMEVIDQVAAERDAAGDHAGALELMDAGMKHCRVDRGTLSRALDYACKAGNAALAATYWHDLPPDLQRKHAAACASHGIKF